ncbi:RNA/RNP complex-1-interacting phosphatase isoform X2 [Sander lucioperca]|uniref:RNA/RNP complex-1-interacting phosphatase isoform X2 n=1 Tax=Sander lucioperca TaxID=283035 RepID=UPI001653E6FE|nr:RNA/RNP complex-1-interacting phosphatase isoform X2 [Sander lucioperca]
MSRYNKKNGIPDRWLDYVAVGKRLPGTRFVAFKVPLKQSLNRKLPCSDVFGPWELLDALSKDEQRLGLIIDLTFTTRYYTLQDLPDSLLFVKIFTAGHEVPSDETILSFKRAVRRFLRENANNDELIGVHCTHGLNRTGYLICRYLIDVDGMDPKEAIKLFNSSRGHAVERQNYLDDLQRGPKRSNVGMEESEQEPMRGLAAQRPSYAASDSDSRDERRPRFNDSRHQRSFSPRETNQRSHHNRHPHGGRGLLPSPPLLPPWAAPPHAAPPHAAPLNPYRWTAPHVDSAWRRPPHSDESRNLPPEETRSRYGPSEESRSRYLPPAEARSRYPVPKETGSRYLPPAQTGSRYPPRTESRSRYLPPERERRPPSRLPEDRRRDPAPPPSLPHYSARWANESNGDNRREEWPAPRMRHPSSTQTHRHRVNAFDDY